MNLLAPKLELPGIKAICIDDLIAPKKIARNNFLFDYHLRQEDVIFSDAYTSSLELLDKHPEISIIFADIRIPYKSEDLHDFDPENPGKEWGKKLLEEEIPKRYPNREFDIFVITSYTSYDLSIVEKNAHHRIRGRYTERVANDDLAQAIRLVVNEYLNSSIQKNNFDYSFLNTETSCFVRERTEQIKLRIQRMEADILAIGNYLIEVKEKIGHGQYLRWLEIEFNWSDRQARRYTGTAKRLFGKLDNLSSVNIDRSAYWLLAEAKTSDKAIEEVLKLAETGEKITRTIVKNVRQKYIKSEPKKIQQSIIKVDKINPKPKQEILSVIPSSNPLENSWWQLGEDHRLFCGEPRNKEYLQRLSEKTALVINFLPTKDSSLILSLESIKSTSSVTFHSEDKGIDLDLMCDLIGNYVENYINSLTEVPKILVFNYLCDVELLEIADGASCSFIVAEPDLEKCEKILTIWREKGEVKRIK